MLITRATHPLSTDQTVTSHILFTNIRSCTIISNTMTTHQLQKQTSAIYTTCLKMAPLYFELRLLKARYCQCLHSNVRKRYLLSATRVNWTITKARDMVCYVTSCWWNWILISTAVSPQRFIRHDIGPQINSVIPFTKFYAIVGHANVLWRQVLVNVTATKRRIKAACCDLKALSAQYIERSAKLTLVTLGALVNTITLERWELEKIKNRTGK